MAKRISFTRVNPVISRWLPKGWVSAAEFTSDETKQCQWRAFADSIELTSVSLEEIVEAIWTLVVPSFERMTARRSG